ncbi:hypothetical protein ACLB2K_051207 [Fragaria x ananassa]
MQIITGPAQDLVGKIFDYAFATVGRQVGYLIHYNRKLENLRTEVAKLSVAKETVSVKIALAENMGEKIYPHVRDWLEKVAAITKEAEELLKDKQQTNTEDTSNLLKDDGQPKTKCVLGICPNPVLRRRRSKNSLTLVEGVTKLINEEKELSDISFKPPKGLKDLETEVDKLKVAKDTLAEKVAAAEVKGEKIHADVQDWLKKVAEITEVVEELLKDKYQSVEEATEFSKDEIQAIEKPNASSSHGSKELLALLQGVTELYEQRNSLHISYVVPPEDVCIASDADYEEFDSRSQMVEKILKELRSTSSSDMILVYGVGGVGKTTLVEEVLRKAQKEKLFQDAVMAVGLSHKSTCRILLTSRSRQVFSQHIKQKEFPLGVLDDKEAWALFEKKAGDVVADPTIRPVAAQVAKKCGGLPVLVITVARALENKNLPIWKNALIQLESFDEKGDLTQKAYSGIEWSYTQLSDKKQLQLLFLLCGSIALGNYISLTTLLKYGIGLGFFKDCTVEVARDALYTQVDKLKSCCLLLDGDDGTCVRMHDLVRDVANRIARRDQHALVEDGGHNKLGKWPDEEFFIECSMICLPCCKIATLPQVPWKCPQLELFHLVRDYDDAVGEIPNNFFEEMKKLKVLGLRSVLLKNLPSSVSSSLKNLPSSVSSLKNLQTLCLDRYDFEDTNLAQVGELRNLEVLSMVYSKVRQLPQEFGQLTRLRLVDLSDCFDLKVIPAGVISNWTKLEDLRLRNSFDKWEGTAKGSDSESEESALTSIASLSELMNLPNLTALEVHIPDGDILPRKFFSDRLEKYQILIGKRYYSDEYLKETTDNILKLQHPPSLNLNENVVMPNLTTLEVYYCDGFKYLFTSSMVRSLVKLKHLKVLGCRDMEEIVSTTESHEEDVDNIFAKLERLRLIELPTFARFGTAGSCIDFPSLEELHVQDCPKLGENVLFDEKVRFPRLEILKINNYGDTVLKKIWHNQLAPGSFCRLREFSLLNCSGVSSIFPPSMTGRLSGLETLVIRGCASARVVFDESGESTGPTTTHLKDGQNLKSVYIHKCHELRYVFPASMVTRGLQQLQELSVDYCMGMRNVVGKEEGAVESTTHPRFIFPKVQSLGFFSMDILESFYPAMHTSEWPSLQSFGFSGDSLEAFAAEVSHFQETQLHAPTKQPFFLIDKGSFPVLEKLVLPDSSEILYGPSSSPIELMFPKLKRIKKLERESPAIPQQDLCSSLRGRFSSEFIFDLRHRPLLSATRPFLLSYFPFGMSLDLFLLNPANIYPDLSLFFVPNLSLLASGLYPFPSAETCTYVLSAALLSSNQNGVCQLVLHRVMQQESEHLLGACLFDLFVDLTYLSIQLVYLVVLLAEDDLQFGDGLVMCSLNVLLEIYVLGCICLEWSSEPLMVTGLGRNVLPSDVVFFLAARCSSWFLFIVAFSFG